MSVLVNDRDLEVKTSNILFLRKFFALVCEVPEPEEKYNMDEFSDAVALSKPVIFISIKEILDTHRVGRGLKTNRTFIKIICSIISLDTYYK